MKFRIITVRSAAGGCRSGRSVGARRRYVGENHGPYHRRGVSGRHPVGFLFHGGFFRHPREANPVADVNFDRPAWMVSTRYSVDELRKIIADAA